MKSRKQVRIKNLLMCLTVHKYITMAAEVEKLLFEKEEKKSLIATYSILMS